MWEVLNDVNDLNDRWKHVIKSAVDTFEWRRHGKDGIV